MSWPNRLTSPRVGRSDRNSSFSSEVLPAPDGPVRNWKEWAGIRKLRSRRISGPRPYRSPTFSNRTKLSSVVGPAGTAGPAGLATDRFCVRYGFRFVNGRLVASGMSRILTSCVMVESGSMHIVCPHCTTSYAIKPETLGRGRAHRALLPLQGDLAGAARGRHRPVAPSRPWPRRAASLRREADLAAQWSAGRRRTADAPVVDSPSIAGDWSGRCRRQHGKADWTRHGRDDRRGRAMPRRAGTLVRQACSGGQPAAPLARQDPSAA